MRLRRWFYRTKSPEIAPDEIFVDSANTQQFDTDQFEGRIERPISAGALGLVIGALSVLLIIFGARAFNLQFINGVAYAKQAAENQLAERIIFADRGLILDREGRELAYNVHTDVASDFAERHYSTYRGLAHIVGYTKAPAKDTAGFYYRTSFDGIEGVEKVFNDALAGENGITLTETDARGTVVSESAQRPPRTGQKIALSLDAEVTQGLYDAIAKRAEESKFQGGAGVIMDVTTGELLAITSYPEYSSETLARGNEESLQEFFADERNPFLNRAVSGLYAPGSIVKPMVAVAALAEGVIDEFKEILSTGSLIIPNPYFPDQPSIFKDWKAHGYTDMREALAVSSDVYFYQVGGGYKDQQGLGIARLDEYFKKFGLGAATGLAGFEEPTGTIPTPEWKEERFDGDPWRLGDTYNTAIGQYGVQVTPLQMARVAATIANSGTLLTPTLIASSTPRGRNLALDPHAFAVAKEGMHMAVEGGTAAALNMPFVEVAGKTGTAQVGSQNQYMNSWVIGFYPYESPRYAFAIVLERAPAGTAVGAPAAMNAFLWWLEQNSPKYLR
jgi:penicillin-binding protein 2